MRYGSTSSLPLGHEVGKFDHLIRVRMVTVNVLFPGDCVVRGSMNIAPTRLKSVQRQKVEAQSGLYHEDAARPKFTSRAGPDTPVDVCFCPDCCQFVHSRAVVAALGVLFCAGLSGVLGHSGCFASLPRRNRVYDSFFPLVRSQGKALADMLCTLTGAVLQIAASLGHTYGIAFRYLPAEVDLLCKSVSKLCGGETAGPRQSE